MRLTRFGREYFRILLGEDAHPLSDDKGMWQVEPREAPVAHPEDAGLIVAIKADRQIAHVVHAEEGKLLDH